MPDRELRPASPPGRRRADWILLDKFAYMADRPNGPRKASRPVATPSRSPSGSPTRRGLNKADFSVVPAAIICAEEDVAILQIRFPSCPTVNPVEQFHYFVYTADHDRPSLRLFPVPVPLCYGNDEFGLLPSTGTDGGEAGFRIAILNQQHPFALRKIDYALHVFSSKTWAWSSRLPRLAPGDLPLCHRSHKVIVLDGSTLGFVDLWDGILCCRVDDDESPVLPLRLIRLPLPMHINKSMSRHASGIRDVVCIDGVIKFVEIANRTKPVLSEPSNDLISHKGIVYGWELHELASNVADTKDPYVYVCDGWVAVTWNRRQTGSDHWLRDCQVDVDDVAVSNPGHFDLLPQLFTSHSGKLKLNKNVQMSAPTFILEDGGVVHLMRDLDKTAFVVLAINTREKTLEDLSVSTPGNSYVSQTYRSCALSKHMSMMGST